MKYTIKQFQKEFGNDDVCLDFVFKARFCDNLGKTYCPKCQKAGFFYRVKRRKSYACKCGYQVYPLKDTIFENSTTRLSDWFFAIYLISKAKNGVSAKELQRHLGTTYKTAWRIANKVRSLMKQGDNLLSGIVEADESYFGKKGFKTGRGWDKTAVMGIVQRGGNIKAKVIPNTQTHTLLNMLSENVRFGSQLITDDYLIYRKADRVGLFHESVNHSKGEFVRDKDIHTNTIEGGWSQLKRSIQGTYHCISVKYLQSYVDEFAYHYNFRFSDGLLFQDLLNRLCKKENQGFQRSISVKTPVIS